MKYSRLHTIHLEEYHQNCVTDDYEDKERTETFKKGKGEKKQRCKSVSLSQEN